MKMMKRFLLLSCLLLVCWSASAQDTIRIYFDRGKSDIGVRQRELLEETIDVSLIGNLREVAIVGYADSTGNTEKNLRLSFKRAQNTADFIRMRWPDIANIQVSAVGEAISKTPQESRRVEVLLIWKPDTLVVLDEPILTPTEAPPTADNQVVPTPLCYYVDYQLLANCRITPIVKNKKPYLQLETLGHIDKKKKRYYGVIDSSGNFTYHRIKWTESSVSKGKFRHIMTRATVPQQDFERFKIFGVDTLPCKTCALDFPAEHSSLVETKQYVPEKFIHKHAEYRRLPFRRNSLQMRIPAYLIDETATYTSNGEPITWKKGRRYNKTKLGVGNINICKEVTMCEYLNQRCMPEAGQSHINCGFVSPLYRYVGVQAGVLAFSEQSIKPYTGVALEWRENNIDFMALYAVTPQAEFIYTTGFRLAHEFDVRIHNFGKTWLSQYELEHPVNDYLEAYAGAKLILMTPPKASLLRPLLMPNLNIGLSFEYSPYRRRPSFTRAFLEGAVYRNLFGSEGPTYNFMLQAGVEFRLFTRIGVPRNSIWYKF